MVQEYVKVLELFEIAKTVAGLQMADYATHWEGLVRVLYTEPGLGAAQVTERYSADGLPYAAGGDAPDGYAMVTFSTDDVDRMRHRDAWLVDDLGRWLNAQKLGWCWQYDDDVWVAGDMPGTVNGTSRSDNFPR